MKFDQRLINLLTFLNGEDAVIAVLSLLTLVFQAFSFFDFLI